MFVAGLLSGIILTILASLAFAAWSYRKDLRAKRDSGIR